MTSMAAESVSTILVSCKQTRFNIGNPNYRELDIEGLNITITSAPPSGDKPAASLKGKAKAAARAHGTEILKDAKLRLKAGQRYALVGRNGSGKSTLLRAVSEKLIPGIPEETRVAILQQTRARDTDTSAPTLNAAKGEDGGRTVLEEVVEKATARLEVEKEIRALNAGINSSDDAYGALRALRTVRHERLQRELFRKDKDARLRSGARGWDARKVLIAMEKTVAESQTKLEESTDSISDDALKRETQEAVDLLADLQLQVEPTRLSSIESQAKKILSGLGFTDALIATPVSALSGGWLMRTALTIALLQETDILILDEPTNYLDLLGIIWLQRYLQVLDENGSSEGGEAPTLLLVSHDRDFLSVCTDLLILKDQQLTYFHGDIATYEESQSERRLWLSKMKDAQDKQKAHIEKSIQNNIKAGKANDDQNKLRQAKSRQKKLDDRWGLQVSARGGRFKLNRDLGGYHLSSRAEIEVPPEERGVHIVLPEPPDLRFPGALISLEKVTFRYPAAGKKGSKAQAAAAPAVLDGIDLSVHMGDRVGILGLNGAGKSTLIKVLVDQNRPSSGTATTHPRLKLGYYSQHEVERLQEQAAEEQPDGQPLTALALLTKDVGGELDEGELRALLGSLGLPGRLASDVPVAKLSGGQLVRLALARILWTRPHCLVLDEVTTHLDYETVTALRVALRDWEGAVVLVSHDRWFVRGVIEGERDDEGSGDEGSMGEDEGEEGMRRRAVYRLRGGKLTLLQGGVTEFEEAVAKRVKKLLGD